MAKHDGELVSIAECARRLAKIGDPVERSALSRYCDSHNLKIGSGSRPKVVFEDVVKARSSYQREVMSGRPGPDLTASPQNPAPIRAENTNIADPADQMLHRNDPSRRKKAAEADKAEIELAKTRGELVAMAEVDAGMADAIAQMRQSLEAGLSDSADQLAAELRLPPEDARTIKTHMKAFVREAQAKFSGACAEVSRDLTADARPETVRSARRRLRELAARAQMMRRRPERGGNWTADAA